MAIPRSQWVGVLVCVYLLCCCWRRPVSGFPFSGGNTIFLLLPHQHQNQHHHQQHLLWLSGPAVEHFYTKCIWNLNNSRLQSPSGRFHSQVPAGQIPVSNHFIPSRTERGESGTRSRVEEGEYKVELGGFAVLNLNVNIIFPVGDNWPWIQRPVFSVLYANLVLWTQQKRKSIVQQQQWMGKGSNGTTLQVGFMCTQWIHQWQCRERHEEYYQPRI